MEKHLKQIRLEYDLFDTPYVPSKQKVVENLHDGLDMIEFYKMEIINPLGVYYADEVLPLGQSKLDGYIDLQERILDGYSYEMNKLMEAVDEENFTRIDKLGRFLGDRLRMNMARVEGKKKNEAFSEMFERGLLPHDYSTRNLPEEDSLFVEVFFAEKFKEITHKDLFVKEKK